MKKLVNKKDYRKAKKEKELKEVQKWCEYYFGGNGKLPF